MINKSHNLLKNNFSYSFSYITLGSILSSLPFLSIFKNTIPKSFQEILLIIISLKTMIALIQNWIAEKIIEKNLENMQNYEKEFIKYHLTQETSNCVFDRKYHFLQKHIKYFFYYYKYLFSFIVNLITLGIIIFLVFKKTKEYQNSIFIFLVVIISFEIILFFLYLHLPEKNPKYFINYYEILQRQNKNYSYPSQREINIKKNNLVDNRGKFYYLNLFHIRNPLFLIAFVIKIAILHIFYSNDLLKNELLMLILAMGLLNGGFFVNSLTKLIIYSRLLKKTPLEVYKKSKNTKILPLRKRQKGTIYPLYYLRFPKYHISLESFFNALGINQEVALKHLVQAHAFRDRKKLPANIFQQKLSSFTPEVLGAIYKSVGKRSNIILHQDLLEKKNA